MGPELRHRYSVRKGTVMTSPSDKTRWRWIRVGASALAFSGICGASCNTAENVHPQKGEEDAGAGGNAGGTANEPDAQSDAPTCPDVDTQTDPSNCGACGNVCPVIAIATAQSSPFGIAVDVYNIYWTNNTGGTVMKAAISGGAPTEIASGQGGPYGIAVDGTNVYWTNNVDGTVMQAPKTGGPALAIASNQIRPWAITVDATNVYWTNGPSGSGGGDILKVPIGGGDVTTLASGQYGDEAIAVDANNVYWTNTSGRRIAFVPISGGVTPTVLAGGLLSPHGIAVDATSVYFTDNGGGGSAAGKVLKVPLGGGTPIELASGLNGPHAVAVDSAYVYWTNSDSPGTVMKVPLDGGEPVTIASDPSSPFAIAVNADSVYWTTVPSVSFNGNTVMRYDPHSCASGTCKCPSGDAVCDDVCVNKQSDATNCGTCGNECAASQTCQDGACQ